MLAYADFLLSPDQPDMKAVIQNALLVLVSLCVGFCMAEALLHVIKPRAAITQEMLTGLGVSDSELNWDRDAELGWIIKANQTFRHVNPSGEFNVQIQTDQYRLRVPTVVTPPVANPDRTILFIGDSVTAGYEVEYEETFVAKVERALSKDGKRVRALNAGIRGYSSEQSLKRLKQLLNANPDITDVVYLYSLNDPFENMSLHFPKRTMTKPGAYLNRNGELNFYKLSYDLGVLDSEAVFIGPDAEICTLPVIGWEPSKRVVEAKLRLKTPTSFLERSYFYILARMVIGTYLLPRDDVRAVEARYPYIKAEYIVDGDGGFMPGDIDIVWEPGNYPLRLLEKIVEEMQLETKRKNVRFLLALPLTSPSVTSKFFREVARKHGMTLSDPANRVQSWVDKCGGSLVFKTDGHYTNCGHSGQADAIAASLSSQSDSDASKMQR